MSTGTKIFRIIICILLALCILSAAFFFFAVYYFDQLVIQQEHYKLSVAGILVTRENQDDILGDGTVFYDPEYNTLVFNEVNIETDQPIIASDIDLGVFLMGENKITSSSTGAVSLISAADYYMNKDLYFYGDGSLTIEYLNTCEVSSLIQCANLTVASDVTVSTPNCTGISNGIVCDSSLMMLSGSSITMNCGTAKSLLALRVRGNMLLDTDSAVSVNVAKGSADGVKGISVSGDLVINDGASVNVSVAEDTAERVECLRVNGLLEVGSGATLTASTAKSHAIECYGAIKLCDGATISAASSDDNVDIICYGAVADYGATVNGGIESLCRIYDKSKE